MFGVRLTLRPARRPPRDGAKPRPRSAVYADRLTRRMLRALIAVQLLGIGTVAALLLIAADGQDRVAAAASRRAVETSLTAMQRRIAGVASDYAMWDEAVDQLHFNRNKTWFDGYYNRDVLDSLQLEDAYILDGENRVTFAYSTLAEGGIQPAIAEQPGVRRLLAAGRTLAPDSVPLAIAGFVLIEGVVHIAGASRIRYIDDARSPPAAAASMLLFARRVDGPGLAVMATEHSLEPLTIVPGAPPPRHRHEEQVVLREFGTDRPIATILWHPEHPGKALLRQTALPTALALAVMLALLWTIARGARRAGRALDCAHAELAAARATLETKVVERTQALRQAEARLRSIFENSAEGIFQLAENGRYLGANPAMAAIFGYPSVEDFLAQAPDHTRQDAERRGEFVRLIETFGKVSDFVSRARRLDASPIWIAQNARLVREADGTAFYEGMLTDITHRKRIEERLVYDALHDPLTGLPNRKLFEQRLTQALAAAGGAAGGGAALRPTVLLLDCDRFKLINDSLGHAAGDELLIVLAQRLSLCLRHTDILARLGGDEFAVLTGIGDGGSVHLAERLQAACRRPFLVRGREVFVTLSIGIAEAGPDLVEPSEVVRNADIAMYQAKSRGRGLTVAFTPDMHAAVLNRLRIESELRQALANDELRVVYQPIVALGGCTLAGFEALVRWQHPERGLIPPSEFIAIAEESRLIKPLGEIVLRRAAADMARWLAESGVTDPLFVSVNLSPLQLEDARLVDRIAGILAETGLPPARLKLEITETAMMANPIEVRAILAALDDLGIRLCIDDFGTGYSSLSQLYSYPFDTLKIDRSFISKLNCGDDGMALVRSILNLAGNLRLAVVAEGVEEPAQHAWLKQEGCTFGQGYLFARPLPAAEAGRMLRRLLPPARAVA